MTKKAEIKIENIKGEHFVSPFFDEARTVDTFGKITEDEAIKIIGKSIKKTVITEAKEIFNQFFDSIIKEVKKEKVIDSYKAIKGNLFLKYLQAILDNSIKMQAIVKKTEETEDFHKVNTSHFMYEYFFIAGITHLISVENYKDLEKRAINGMRELNQKYHDEISLLKTNLREESFEKSNNPKTEKSNKPGRKNKFNSEIELKSKLNAVPKEQRKSVNQILKALKYKGGETTLNETIKKNNWKINLKEYLISD